MIYRLALTLLLVSSFAVAKDTVSVEVKESVSVTMTHHDAISTLFNKQQDQRQVQSFDLKAIINGQHVVLACDAMSHAGSQSACDSIAPGTYSGELRGRDGKFLTLHYTAPLTGKERKQNYAVQGSW
jgi:hypothetical protein